MIHTETDWTTKVWHPELSNIGNCTIGKYCVIHSHVWIASNVVIGDKVKIQAFTFIPEGVTIESNVFIGPHVCFTNDPLLETRGPEGWAKTIVKEGAKIGANACIKAGVVIGRNATIGMGAVVLTSVPENEVWAGNPAKRIR